MIENSYGIVLQRQATLSGDLWIHLLSHDGRKIPCYAKGAGLAHSKRRRILEPFTKIAWTIRKSKNHPYLGECQSLQSFHRAQADLWILQSLLCYGEFLQKSLPQEHHHPEIYELLHESLEFLHEKIHSSIVLRLWLQSLEVLGYLNLKTEAFEQLDARYQKGLQFLKNASIEEASKLILQSHESEALQEILFHEAEKHLEQKLQHKHCFNLANLPG